MQTIDLSANPRIPVLMRMFTALADIGDPWEQTNHLLSAFREVYGGRAYVQVSTAGQERGGFSITRAINDDGGELIDMAVVRRRKKAPIHRGGFISHIIAAGSPILLRRLDLRDDAALGPLLGGFCSALAVPVLNNAMEIDWIILLERDPEGFSEKEVEDAILRANLSITMISNLQMTRQLQRANERIAREIEQIAGIQRALLPSRMPDIPGVAISASYQTFDRVGGDIYDFRKLKSDGAGGTEERWALLIGDASGHGPAASVVMAMCSSILHAYPLHPAGPAELLGHVNDQLCSRNIDQSFVTAFLGFYKPRTRQLVYARAGHNPPILKQFPHTGSPQRLDAVGEVPLGILPNIRYSEASLTLQPGQTLIMYTDGITEAMRPDGTMFEVEGIEHSLVECSGDPACAIDHITNALKRHQAESRPDDDQTLVVMKVL